MTFRATPQPAGAVSRAQGSDRPADDAGSTRPDARLRELDAEVARLRAECEDCRLIVELSRERDTAARRARELAEFNRLKSDLFAEVSHEFRTPLTLVLGPLQDLEAGDCGELSDLARQQVQLASRNARRLQGLVEQILDTARLDAGRLELRFRHGDLLALLADLRERCQGLAERRS